MQQPVEGHARHGAAGAAGNLADLLHGVKILAMPVAVQVHLVLVESRPSDRDSTRTRCTWTATGMARIFTPWSRSARLPAAPAAPWRAWPSTGCCITRPLIA